MRSGSRSGYETSGASAIHPPRAKSAARAPNEMGGERIAALSALVEELSGQIDLIEGASRRDVIRRGVKAAAQTEPARARAEPAYAAPAHPAGGRLAASYGPADPQAERLSAIQNRLAAIAEHIALRDRPAETPPPARRDEIGSLQAAIAEISERQQAIDRASGNQLAAIDTIALEDALQALRGDIAALDRRIAAEARRGEELGRSLRSEITERSAMPASNATEAALAAFRDDLGAIREQLDLAARETTLASIETGYGHVIERLDDIVRRVPERTRIDALGQEISRLAEKIETAPRPRAIDGELEDIRNAIASISVGRADETLDQQFAELRRAIERLGEETHGSRDLTRIEERLDQLVGRLDGTNERQIAELGMAIEKLAAGKFGGRDLSRIEERLDALAGRFDGSNERRIADLGLAIEKLAARPRENVDLSRIERDIGAMRREIDGFTKGTDPVALIRLEQQVAAIRTALEEKLPARTDIDPGALGRLEDRLDALAGRLDALADLPNLIAPASGDAILGLRSEISELRRDVAQREPAGLGQIEDQLRGLMRRLDEAANRDDGPALAQLEAQVGALADKFMAIEPGAEALSKVEANLGRLQSLLADARQDAIETARTTARTTVEEFAGSLAPGRDDAMVSALREDLRRLQDAALHADEQNQNTLEAVHDTLAKVVDRIAQLEAEDTAATLSYASIKERARAAIPSRAFPAEGIAEDHRPLAPGSGKPDIAGTALHGDSDPAARQGDRKADFIAAARRAAQAAQAETARARAEERQAGPREEKPGPLARIGQALRSRRRPLVLAIAAVVLAIGAAKLAPSMQQHLVDALAPAAAVEQSADLDRTSTGSIAPKPFRKAEPNPVAAHPAPSASAAPAMVAPKGNSDAIAFSPDPFSGYLDATPSAPPPAATVAVAAPAQPTLDYALVQRAAAKGDAIAAFEMGQHLAEPETGKPDIKLAAEWYERSAKAGFALAQYRLGSLYERGEGVKLDVATAQRWYEKASVQGNARAIHNLAVLISEGASGKPDYKRAADLFIAAATFGIADSQYNLGVLYARGLGVPVDLVQSYKWFALAALAGDGEAGKRRDEVAKAMKADDLASARLAVQGFQPKALDRAANIEPTPDPSWYSAAGATSMSDAPAGGVARGGSAT